MRNAMFLAALVAAGCHGSQASTRTETGSAAPVPPRAVNAGSAAVAPATPAPPALPGAEFIADATLLDRIAACGDGPLPDHIAADPKLQAIVEHHCKRIREQIDKFRAAYFVAGRPWFDGVVPKDAPKTVVYPFGGGDLISALVAFPDASEITTISLELAGDPRRIESLPAASLDRSLGALRAEIGGLISVGSNTSLNLSAQQRNDLPGQVSSFLLGLVAGGYEPLSMRYFTLDEVGDIHYLEQAEIDTLDKQAHEHHTHGLKHDWQSPSFSTAFANVEIQYRKIGETAVRVHRHIAWNLGDEYMQKHPQLIRHLEKKGKVTMLTKGGSYMLWHSDFSLIRGYMLDHLAWMLSDSTGIPPAYASEAGMVQETYGYYHGAFLANEQETRHDDAFIALWRDQPRRKLPFRFGYVDKDKEAHLVVTKPRA